MDVAHWAAAAQKSKTAKTQRGQKTAKTDPVSRAS